MQPWDEAMTESDFYEIREAPRKKRKAPTAEGEGEGKDGKGKGRGGKFRSGGAVVSEANRYVG